MVCGLASQVQNVAIAEENATTGALKGVTQKQLDSLKENARKYILSRVETTNKILQKVSWYELAGWDDDIREQIYDNFSAIEVLGEKNIHINSIIRVMTYGKTAFKEMQEQDPAELKRMICRPGPEPILYLLEKVAWASFMKLDHESREDLLTYYNSTLDLLQLAAWDALIALPKELRKQMILKNNLVGNWIAAGATWEEISKLSLEEFQSIAEKPTKMPILLECAPWREILALEPGARRHALQEALKISKWINEEKLTWEQCLARLKVHP